MNLPIKKNSIDLFPKLLFLTKKNLLDQKEKTNTSFKNQIRYICILNRTFFFPKRELLDFFFPISSFSIPCQLLVSFFDQFFFLSSIRYALRLLQNLVNTLKRKEEVEKEDYKENKNYRSKKN